MLEIARTDQRIRVSIREFDKDPDLLPVLNGVLNLATGRLLGHDPSHMNTMQAPVWFDPAASTTEVEAWLDELALAGLEVHIWRPWHWHAGEIEHVLQGGRDAHPRVDAL